MSRAHRIEMAYYSHPWNLHTLAPMLPSAEDTVLVEVAERSMLDVLAEDPEAPRSGVLSLLRRPRRVALSRLGTRLPHVPCPVVLAPNPVQPMDRIVDALRILDVAPCDRGTVLLLCHVRQAHLALPLHPIVDRFHILWDSADTTGPELLECARTLVDEGSLDASRWGGFHVHNHWLRESPEQARHHALLKHTIQANGI